MILKLKSKTNLGFVNLDASSLNFENNDMINYINFVVTVKKLVKLVSKYNDR